MHCRKMTLAVSESSQRALDEPDMYDMHLTTALTLLAQVVPSSGPTVPALGFRMGHGFRPDVHQQRQTPQPLDAGLEDGS